MSLFKPSHLHEFLASLGVTAKKTLSQNFLIDGNVIQKTLLLADVKAGDWVLEIGPGPGALTEALLASGARVIAVEKDSTFASALYRLQTPDNRLQVIEGDALDLDHILPIVTRFSEGNKGKIIANLPYHITSPILIAYCQLMNLFTSVTVMVQKEVGERIAAKPGNKAYGSLTVFLNFFTSPQYGFTVQPGSFSPKPKVHSAVVKLDLHEPPIKEVDSFFHLTRGLFSQRRKMIRSTLKKLYGEENAEKMLNESKIDPTLRPENLSLKDFLKLHEYLA